VYIMQNLLRKIKMEKREHLTLSILLIMYILLEVHLPAFLSGAVDSIYGKVALYLLALHIFFNVCKVSGVLALIAVYTMIKRASLSSGNFAIREYLPSEERKVMDFSKFNDFPYTLEEEEVARMAPVVRNETSVGSAYKPVLAGLHDAAPTDYEGVI